ncbi:MAG: hypothetical protein OXF77_05305 [Thaumarchaeota archaeon]|nr:hypothetical protein [Nitrososphaerota archaeon]
MSLHIGYETCPEADIDCLVDNRLIKDGRFASPGLIFDTSDSLKNVFKINKKMKLILNKEENYEIHINERCRLIDIPKSIDDYTISGRSPLKWAIEVLSINTEKFNKTGIKDDPNQWYIWHSNSFELIRHLRRLIYLSLKSAEIINSLPQSLSNQNKEGKNE